MSEFLQQLMVQLRDVWARFNTMQRVILIAVFSITFVGLLTSVAISSMGESTDKNSTLFANLNIEEAGKITEYLKENKIPYTLENDGRTISVPKEQVSEVRMELARNGLPEQGGTGYELFDKTNLGVTDFVQNLNYKRALEGELKRSVETIKEVEYARVHIAIPKETIFQEKKEESRASVMVKVRAGQDLSKQQVAGITHLVASAVEGLKSRQVQVIDHRGNMLTQGFAGDSVAERTDHNMELQRSVERHLENKVNEIMQGVLGPNKARVKVSAVLDFDRIEKRVENYDPKEKVVRSEQRDDGTRINVPPENGNETKEGSITNYEIDRELANIIGAPGNTKRISVSVAVDGSYEEVEGERKFVPRSDEQLAVLNNLVRNAVGFDSTRNDQVFVASLQFDNTFVMEETQALEGLQREEWIKQAVRWTLIIAILLFGFWALRRVLRDVVSAMNPPLPRYAGIDLDVEEDEVSEDLRRHNDLLERMEMAVHDNPQGVAELIRTWMREAEPTSSAPKRK
jgi:flagellar M-ring protein FliF